MLGAGSASSAVLAISRLDPSSRIIRVIIYRLPDKWAPRYGAYKYPNSTVI